MLHAHQVFCYDNICVSIMQVECISSLSSDTGQDADKKSRHQKNDAGFLLVGMTRLELATPASRTQYATNCATSRIASAKLQLILEICNKNRKKYTFLKKNTKKLAQFKKKQYLCTRN